MRRNLATMALLCSLGLAAMPPVEAEVPCDPALFGPGLDYTANIPNATDFVDAALELGREFGPESTLVVMDVDNTLLAMIGDLGSDQWYRWQEKLLAEPGPNKGEVAPDFDGMLDVQRLLFSARPMRPTQPDMAEIVARLQELGYPVMALTARGPENIGATLRELLRNGIDMSKTAPTGLPDMAGAHLPFDVRNPARAGLSAADLSSFKLGAPRPVIYKGGVYMVAGQHKGAMLQILLRRLGRHYPAILLLDDQEKNVCEMAQAFRDGTDLLTAFRYDGERLHAKSFLQDKKRQAAATRDWRLMTARLPALCESVPESCGLPTDSWAAEAASAGTPTAAPVPPTAVALPERPLRITTWNLEHMMSAAVFQDWVAACRPHDWDDEAAQAAGKPAALTYCNAHSGRSWPCGDRQEALALRTAEAFEKKVAALRTRAAEIDADIIAFQEVGDMDAVARILPENKYEILFAPADIAMNVAFAVRKELAPGIAARPVRALSVCAVEDRMDPADPASCLADSYRTRPGLELTLNTGDKTIALLNVHLKSSCRGHPLDDPPLDSLEARACQATGFDQAKANANYRANVAKGCALLRDQIPAIEAWVEAQSEAGNRLMVLGDFNRNFVGELRRRMPARLDGTDPRDPILPTTEIGSILKEVSVGRPDGTFLYLARQQIDALDRTCRSPDGTTYEVRGCHQGIDHFLIGKHWAEAVAEDPKGLTARGADYGDAGYCAEHARPSDHCPLTLEISVPKAAPMGPEALAATPPLPPPVVSPPAPAQSHLPLPPEGIEGEPLRAWLKEHWYDGKHRTLGYSAARRIMYSLIDVAADGRVYGVYSGFSQPMADTTFLDPINAEHTVPQSWFGRGDPMKSDLHHLFPTHKDVNSARGSDPFGEIPDAETTHWYGLRAGGGLSKLTAIPRAELDVYSEDRPDEFEPREGHEGDLARALFYFYSMYPDRARPIDRLARDGLETLQQWHVQDPPDAWEVQRNSRIEAAQGNRNPYVDHPDLTCRAWGFVCR